MLKEFEDSLARCTSIYVEEELQKTVPNLVSRVACESHVAEGAGRRWCGQVKELWTVVLSLVGPLLESCWRTEAAPISCVCLLHSWWSPYLAGIGKGSTEQT